MASALLATGINCQACAACASKKVADAAQLLKSTYIGQSAIFSVRLKIGLRASGADHRL
jgi:hypothetical protein